MKLVKRMTKTEKSLKEVERLCKDGKLFVARFITPIVGDGIINGENYNIKSVCINGDSIQINIFDQNYHEEEGEVELDISSQN